MSVTKASLCELFGCTAADLEQRINTFQAFTSEPDEYKTLLYLKKMDLDAERAINMFLNGVPVQSRSPSAGGSPKKPERKEPKEIHFDFSTMDSDEASDEMEEPAPKPKPKRKAPARRKRKKQPEPEKEKEAPKKKKRKVNESEEYKPSPEREASKSASPERVLQSRPKQRRQRKAPAKKTADYMNMDESSEDEDANLTFSKPSAKPKPPPAEETENMDPDFELPQAVAPVYEEESSEEEKCDPNWTRKIVGNVEIVFESTETVEPNFFRDCRSLKEGLTGKNLTLADEKEKALVDEIIKGQADKYLDVWVRKIRGSPMAVDGKKDKKDSDKKQKVKVKFFIYLIRAAKTTQMNELMKKFGSITLKDSIKESDGLPKQFQDAKLKLNMDGLLDFACRYTTTKDEEAEFSRYPDQRHGLYKITLNDYQHQAINWMIKEERCREGVYRHFFKKCQFKCGSKFWYSPFFQTTRFEKPPKAHGGILCEEMGLGKTIEILALCNSNRSPAVKPPYMAKDHENKDVKRIPVKGTLIIAPTSLVGQWDIEITKRHKNKPKTLLYYGGKRTKDPAKLAQYHFVITTYGVLTSRIEREKSPLMKCDWWRVVLDESHSIKGGNTKQAKLCRQLKARNKWGITGTPFNTTVTDLKEQLNFVGLLDPVDKKKWWDDHQRQFLNGDHKSMIPMYQLMGKMIMRHKKSQQFNGHDIVQLPPKEEGTMAIEFTETQKKVYQMLFKTARTKYDAYKRAGLLAQRHLTVNGFLVKLRKACSGGNFKTADVRRELDAALRGDNLPAQRAIQASGAAQAGVGQMAHAVTEEEAFNADEEECSICLELIEDPLQTPCRHVFCGDCIRPLIETRGERCPICRKPVKVSQLKKPKGTEDKKEEEKKKKKSCSHDGPDVNSLDRVIFDAKLKILLARLMAIKKDKPKEKSLVFTTWGSTLEWLRAELPKRGFKFRTITGSMTMEARRKALVKFQADPPTTIFLLSVRSGAVGITLTAAQHVFMMEPCMNPALYRQAVNRVYRLGQTKQVHITTLYMKNTIEESIITLNKEKNVQDYSAGNIKRDKAEMRAEEWEELFKDYDAIEA